MRILRDDTIALIIDVQQRLLPAIHHQEVFLNHICTLVQGLHALGIPMMVTEQYPKGLGPTTAPLIPLVEGQPRLEKNAFSCCDEPSILEKLQSFHRHNVLVCGIESHICVLQTVIDLKQNQFRPVVVVDCIGSRTPENKAIATERMKQEGITLTSYESILFELCRYAGTDEFRVISKLIK